MNALRVERLERPAITTAPTPVRTAILAQGPAWQAFQLLHWAFVVLPLTVGADKFFAVLAPWRSYLSPSISDVLGVSGEQFIHTVGVAEILLGILVAFAPRLGGWLVAGWLWAITVNLFLTAGYADVALRDLGLSLAALALARLATVYQDAVEPPRARRQT